MITYLRSTKIWVSHLPFAAHQQLKGAGWKFHGRITDCKRPQCRLCAAGVDRRWWTDAAEAVRAINTALWDTSAADAVKEHRATVDASTCSGREDIEIPAPHGLSYLPFQKAGIAYIRDVEKPRRVLVGDDMGLGKTIQAIGYANLSMAPTILVVCPATLRLNWKRELERWLVEPRDIHVVDSGREPPLGTDVVIVNYDRLVRDGIRGWLMEWWWQILIADEAHYLKSSKAKRTIAVLGSPGNKKKKEPPQEGLIHRSSTFLALTGTAMLNRPIEMWTLVHALDPQGFPDRHEFGKRYCAGEQKRIGWDKKKGAPKMAWDFSGASNLSELQDKLRGRCMVRRLKRDVLSELPPKRHEIIILDPRGPARDAVREQMRAFEETRAARKVREVTRAAEAGDRQRYEAVVAELEAELEVAFDGLSRERRRLAEIKVPLVADHLRNLLDNHGVRRVVVFAHHHVAIDGLRAEFGDRSVVVDGRTPHAERQAAVDVFCHEHGPPLFIAGIRAAGEGITLTTASHVVFAEMDWTPARNAQAEDRCHRIGQRDMVLIQHLVFDDSVDALVAKTVIYKMKIAEQVLNHA